MNLAEFTNLTIPMLEKEMKRLIDESLNSDSKILKDIFIYHLGLNEKSGVHGKRIRPLLLLSITHAAGINWGKALSAAVAVEFLHNFSLIHDDVEDQSDLRHGRPTVWSTWGTSQAINAGDGMYTLVFQAIHGLIKCNSPEITLAAVDLITRACMKLVEGQFNDMAFEEGNEITIDDYWKMIDGKTAALLACSAQLGGLIAGLDQRQQDILNLFGQKLGRGFQIQDDLLGIWGNPDDTGKSIDSDLINHKQTLPVIYGIQMSQRFKDRWHQGKIKKDEIPSITEWLKQDGVYLKVQEIYSQVNDEVDKLLIDLNLSNTEGVLILKEMLDGLRERNH